MSKQKKKALVPTLRFPEFRDAGEWGIKRLGEIGEIVTGKTPSTTDESLWNGDIQFVTPTDITDEKYQRKTQRSIVGGTRTKTLPKHSTMFTCIASIGKMSLSVHPCITNQQINTVIPNDNYENEFVYYSLLNIVPSIKAAQSNTTLPIINKTDFSKFTLPIPSTIPEQQKIADCLSSIDELITAHSQKLDTLKTHKKGLMQQLFPREGETVPRLRFPEFRDAGEWEEKKLGQLANYTKGFAFKSQDYRGEGVRIIRVSDLGADFIKPSNEKIFIASESASDYERYVLNMGEIIITTVGSKPELIDSAVGRGIFVYSPNEGLLNQNLLKLEVLCGVNSRFLFSNINTEKYQKFIASISRGNANQANIAVKDLMGFELQVPDPEEQNKIASCLTSIDDLITAQTQKVEALKTHKKGLMQQLFPAIDEQKDLNHDG